MTYVARYDSKVYVCMHTSVCAYIFIWVSTGVVVCVCMRIHVCIFVYWHARIREHAKELGKKIFI